MKMHINSDIYKSKKIPIAIKISIISLIISTLSLLFDFYIWNIDNTSSISVSGDLSYIPLSYESFTYDYGLYQEEFGRFLMSGDIYITNNTSKGCVLDDDISFSIFNGYCSTSSEIVEKWFENSYDIFVGNDPFHNVYLNGLESIIVNCQIYIYLNPTAHIKVKEKFGNNFSVTEVKEIINYLYYNYPKETYYEPPRYGVPYKETRSAEKYEYLGLVIYSNTGASDTYNIDYKNLKQHNSILNNKYEYIKWRIRDFIHEFRYYSFGEKILILIIGIISFTIIFFIIKKSIQQIIRLICYTIKKHHIKITNSK